MNWAGPGDRACPTLAIRGPLGAGENRPLSSQDKGYRRGFSPPCGRPVARLPRACSLVSLLTCIHVREGTGCGVDWRGGSEENRSVVFFAILAARPIPGSSSLL